MLQRDTPTDYVIATGNQHSVRDFIIWTANALGIEIDFKGEGVDEVGIVAGVKGDLSPAVKIGQTIVRIDERYFRPSEVETLLGDASKAKDELGWLPKISAHEMCIEMVEDDYKSAQRHVLLKQNNLSVPVSIEK